MLLVAAQPDMGTALTFVALFVAADLPHRPDPHGWSWLLALAGVLAAAAGWMFVLKPYQKNRILTFFGPESDPLGAGYQTVQSKIAIGSGGLLGQGLRLRHPEPARLPARKAHRLHLLGAGRGVGLRWVPWSSSGSTPCSCAAPARRRCERAGPAGRLPGRRHNVDHLRLTSPSTWAWSRAVMPTIGIPLPLMSYGGSSVISTFFAIGSSMNVGAALLPTAEPWPSRRDAKELIINSTPYETRVAVLEDGRSPRSSSSASARRASSGNIYKGGVDKVLPGMQSAFVDIGLDRRTPSSTSPT